MSTLTCRQCGSRVDAAATSCPRCGAFDPADTGAARSLRGPSRSGARRRGVYIALVVAAALFVALCFRSDEARGTPTTVEAAETSVFPVR